VFHQLREEGRTIVLVTHDMAHVERFCHRAMLLEEGRLELIGEPSEVARRYLELNFERRPPELHPTDEFDGTPGARFVDVWLEDGEGRRTTSYEQDEEIRVCALIEAERELLKPRFSFEVRNADGVKVFSLPLQILDRAGGRLSGGDTVRVRARVANPLALGHYFVHCSLMSAASGPVPVAFRRNAVDFLVFGLDSDRGLVKLDHRVDLEWE
jgi:hypothetical protein